jgi:hypothetical protein
MKVTFMLIEEIALFSNQDGRVARIREMPHLLQGCPPIGKKK